MRSPPLPGAPAPERVFLGWGRPLLTTAAEFLVEHHLGDGLADLRTAVVVAPASRGGRRLKERLLEECEKRRVRLLPPRVIGLRDVPELFYRAERPPASPLARRRAWGAALKELPAGELEFVMGRAPEQGDERAWDLMGGAVAQLQREVAGGGYRFSEVAEVCGADARLLVDDSERWRVLARAQEAYLKRLTANGLSDPDLERLTALRRPLHDPGVELWLLGAAEMTPVAANYLRASPAPVRALVHAPASEAAAFDELGRIDPGIWGKRAVPLDDRHLRITGDPADQAAAVLDVLGELGDVSPGDVVIGMPDDSLRPYLQEWLEDAGVPTHFAAGAAMDRAGPYRLLEALADFLESGAWGDLAALVRHPDLERLLGPAASIGADDLFGRHLPQRVTRAGPAAHALHNRVSWGRRVDTLLAPLRGERPLGEWPLPLMDLLVAVYGGRPLDPDRPDDRRTIQVLQEVRDAALALRNLPAELGCRCSSSFAIRAILDELGTKTIAEDTELSAIDLLGWLELPLDDAPHVIVTGANEPALPESLNAHRFLPDSLRRRLGLADNALRFARDVYHLTALLGSRRSVRVIAGRVDAEGNPLRPSRLLLTVRGEQLARRVLAFASSDGDGRRRPAPLEARAAVSSSFSLPPQPVLRFPPPEELSVTDFGRYLGDPYRFVLERLIGRIPADDSARELDAAGFGILAHDVLSHFSRGPAGSSADADEVRAELDRLLDRAVEQRFGGSAYPSVYLQAEHLRLRLHRFAEWQAERMAEGWRTVLVEGSPVTEEADGGVLSITMTVDGEPLRLRGRIDRIDHHPEEGRWALLDYKTSDKPQTPNDVHLRGRPPEWRDLQLPLYRHLVRAVPGADGSPLIPPDAGVELGYIRLSRELDASCCEIADWGAAQLEEADEVAAEVVRALRQGEVRFAGARTTYPGDPLAPLLGQRQFLAAEQADLLEGAGEEGR